ncbi:hypothetical protein STAS_07723 [Striga asiatica]|uniref:Uncharacterized protein n=1 Tax=Striga asiatica TaxID=4170 RepID=A0A5A7PGJ1_STRAF|nr:hypothetical protein STAS_07723 [Striga asiatica]
MGSPNREENPRISPSPPNLTDNPTSIEDRLDHSRPLHHCPISTKLGNTYPITPRTGPTSLLRLPTNSISADITGADYSCEADIKGCDEEKTRKKKETMSLTYQPTSFAYATGPSPFIKPTMSGLDRERTLHSLPRARTPKLRHRGPTSMSADEPHNHIPTSNIKCSDLRPQSTGLNLTFPDVIIVELKRNNRSNLAPFAPTSDLNRRHRPTSINGSHKLGSPKSRKPEPTTLHHRLQIGHDLLNLGLVSFSPTLLPNV